MAMCKSCGAYITFGTTKNGKLMPLNNDGTPHWATCLNPSVHRKRKPVKKKPGPKIYTNSIGLSSLDFEIEFDECIHATQLETKTGLKCLDCGKIYNEATLEWESEE